MRLGTWYLVLGLGTWYLVGSETWYLVEIVGSANWTWCLVRSETWYLVLGTWLGVRLGAWYLVGVASSGKWKGNCQFYFKLYNFAQSYLSQERHTHQMLGH